MANRTLDAWCLSLIIPFIFLLVTVNGHHGEKMSSDSSMLCGGHVNGTTGFIQTPNFPSLFPVPLSCTWVFHAPPGERIVLYFTQLYVRHNFFLEEYDYYHDDNHNSGKYDLGEVKSFESDITAVKAYKPYLVLRFAVEDITNLHVRVSDFLLDVYGFNITYEVIQEDESTRPDACSVFQCSYLGDCLASQDFSSYSCRCFPGFFGNECQYGPLCDPDLGKNNCANGGICRYIMGSTVNSCDCPPGFGGLECKTKIPQTKTECHDLDCEHGCHQLLTGISTCACNEGYRLAEDNKTCIESSQWRYVVNMRLIPDNSQSENSSLCSSYAKQLHTEVLHQLQAERVFLHSVILLDIVYESSDATIIRISFSAEEFDRARIMQSLRMILSVGTLYCGTHRIDTDGSSIVSLPVLQAVTLDNQSRVPVTQGQLITLVCSAKGAENSMFTWWKDGSGLDPSRSMRHSWTTRVKGRDGETQISELSIEKAVRQDEGEYECRVSDGFEEVIRTLHVHVVPTPHMEVLPMSATVLPGSTLVVTCLSRDDEFNQFRYTWLRDGDLIPGRAVNKEAVEELFPAGSRLIVRDVSVPAVYTCVIDSDAGRSQASSILSVLSVKGDGTTVLCWNETHREVAWNLTLGGHVDYQLCPRQVKGRASRVCECDSSGGQCSWREPNLANCSAVALDMASDRMERLSLGYLVTSVGQILSDVSEFVERVKSGQLYIMAGDLKLIMNLLKRAQMYTNMYDTDRSYFQTTSIGIRLAEFTMNERHILTEDEAEEVRLEFLLLHYVRQLVNDVNFMMNINTYPKLSLVRFDHLDVLHEQESNGYRYPVLASSNGVGSGWLAVYNKTLTERCMSRSLPTHYRLESQVALLEIHDTDDLKEHSSPPTVTINFPHQVQDDSMDRHRSLLCASWMFESETEGRWDMNACSLLEGEGHVECECQWSGYFAVISSPSPVVAVMLKTGPSSVIFAGAITSLVIFSLNVVVRACFWGQLHGDSKAISLNLSLVMIAVDCILIGGFSSTNVMAMCNAVKLVFFALLLCAASLTLAESLRLYEQSNWGSKRTGCLKDVVIGYGVPSVPVLCTVLTGKLTGISHKKDASYCWFCVGDWEMLVFTVTASLIVLAVVALTALTLRNVMCANMYRYRDERNTLLFYISRAVMEMIYLFVLIGASFPMACYHDNTVTELLFTTALIALSLSHALLYRFKTLKNFFSACNLVNEQCMWRRVRQKELDHNGRCGALKSVTLQSDVSNVNLDMLQPLTNGAVLFGNQAKSSYPRGSYKAFLLPTSVADEEDDMRTTVETELTLGSSVESGHCSGGITVSVTSSAETQQSQTSRHSTSVICACPKCLDTYPFKPGKGRAYISQNDASDTETLSKKSVSFSCRMNGSEEDMANSERRKSMPNPFPELKCTSQRRCCNCVMLPSSRTAADSSRRSASPRSPASSRRVFFQLGGSDLDIDDSGRSSCSSDNSVKL